MDTARVIASASVVGRTPWPRFQIWPSISPRSRALSTSLRMVRQAVRTIGGEVDRARERGDIDGHIWNLGHGVLPTTDAEAITRAVSIIHEEG